jgi:hypothetical protein
MCQFEPAQLPGFITTFAATDVIALLLLIVVLWMVVNLVNDPRSLGVAGSAGVALSSFHSCQFCVWPSQSA